MTKIQDIPASERWPFWSKVLSRKVLPIFLVVGSVMGLTAFYLWFVGGAQPITHTSITVTNGIQTTVTTSTVNLFAQTLFNYLALPSLCLVAFPIEFWLLVHTRLNTPSDEEVEG